MRDDQPHPEDDDRFIDLHEPYELRDWARTLCTTPESLRSAVLAVGDRVRDVRSYLNVNGKTGVQSRHVLLP